MSALWIIALLGHCLADAEPSTVAVFQPGHEGCAQALIAPYDSDDLEIEGWTLDGMSPGPECAVRFTFVRAEARIRYVFGTEALDGGAATLRVEEGAGERAVALTRAFEALLSSNDHAAIFRDACLVRIADSHEALDLGEAAPPDPVVPTGRHAAEAVMVLLPLVLLGFLLLRRAEPAPARPPRSSRERIVLGLLIGAAVFLRLLVAWYLPARDLELENFPRDTNLWGLGHIIGSFVHPPPPQTFHAPLLDSILQGWSVIGDALGVGGGVLWLRLPNMLLSGLLVWLLLRLGEALGDARIGWIAGATFAASPLLIQISVPQGHYFLEMVAVTWFLERLASRVIARRPGHRTLAVAAALALWSGSLAAVVVGPGLLVHTIHTWRRGDRRRALGVLFLVLALTAPVVGAAIANALDMSAIASHAAPTAAANEGLAAVYGHTVMEPAADGAAGMPALAWDLTVATVGVVVAPLLLILLVVALVRRPRERWGPPLILLVFVALGTALPLRTANFTALMPVILVGGIQAILDAVDRFLPRRIAGPAVAALLVGLIGGSLATDSIAAEDRSLLALRMARWITVGHIGAVMDVARAPEHRALPLVRGTWFGDTAYHLCEERTTRAGVVACMDRPKEEPVPGLLRYPLGAREVWEIRLTPGDAERCPPALADDAPIAQLRGPLLLALDPAFVVALESRGCRDPRVGRTCRSLAAAPEVELWLCER